MSGSETVQPEGGLLLEEVLDHARALPLAATLRERRGADLDIHAGEVRHLGAQCAQVLLSAGTTWQIDGHALHIADPSEAFIQGARLLGIDAALGVSGHR